MVRRLKLGKISGAGALKIKEGSSFRKDVQRMKKRGKALNGLKKVIALLADGSPLPGNYKLLNCARGEHGANFSIRLPVFNRRHDQHVITIIEQNIHRPWASVFDDVEHAIIVRGFGKFKPERALAFRAGADLHEFGFREFRIGD